MPSPYRHTIFTVDLSLGRSNRARKRNQRAADHFASIKRRNDKRYKRFLSKLHSMGDSELINFLSCEEGDLGDSSAESECGDQ